AGITFVEHRAKLVREAKTAGDRADGRHDDVANQRRHDRSKSSADDDADRQVDDIAAQREFLEFLQHGSLPKGSAQTPHKCGLLKLWPQVTAMWRVLCCALPGQVSASASSDFASSGRMRSSNRVSRWRFDALRVMRSNFARSCSGDSGVSGQPSQVSIWPPKVRPSLRVTSRRAPQPLIASLPETRIACASVRTRESRTTWSLNTDGSSGSW